MLVGVLMRRIRLVFGCGLIELGGKFVLLVLDWNSKVLTVLCVCLCFCLFVFLEGVCGVCWIFLVEFDLNCIGHRLVLQIKIS